MNVSSNPVLNRASATPASSDAKPAAIAGQNSWTWTALDQQWADEIQRKLPAKMFDTHMHLYDRAHLNIAPPKAGDSWGQGLQRAEMADYIRYTERHVGCGRIAGGLAFGFPTANGDNKTINQFMVDQVASMPHARAQVLVRPHDDPKELAAWARHPKVVGVKVYHVYSPHKPTMDSPIDGYFPEWIWKHCHEHGWTMTLHIVRAHALDDEDNIRQLRQLCSKYPNARLILAHAGRGFNAWDTIRGVARLRGLENVWFDSSCVCEVGAFTAILREFGTRRLMWGSDFPVTERRGKCVSVGDRFSWIEPATIDQLNPLGDACENVLVGLESLRALLQAADEANLDERDRIDLFHDNAARLLNLPMAEVETGPALYQRAKKRIPGGTQLLSKRPEMFLPEQWPTYFSRARGCETWDLQDRRFYDMSISGIGSCLLGFADPDVTRAVMRRVQLGSMSSLNPPEEVELADLLCELHPWATQARFTRTGGEAMVVAVRVARATTGRSKVGICGYHGWHDWYLAANLGDAGNLQGHLLPGLEPAGVPVELRGTAFPFPAGELEGLKRLIAQHGKELAAIVLEPMRNRVPPAGLLQSICDLARSCGALVIFDEITIGWRQCVGGAHLTMGATPDMAVFAKALGNGHPIGAVIGSDAAMQGAHQSFISSSYWTESVGPVAAVATLRKMQRVDVPAHLRKVGARAAQIWGTHGKQFGLPISVQDGCLALCGFTWDHPQAMALKTLYTQHMLDAGFLASQTLYATLAHDEPVMEKFDHAVAATFERIAGALKRDAVVCELRGPVAHSGFRRLVQ